MIALKGKGFKTNRHSPTVGGVGFLGGTTYNSRDHRTPYFVWVGMLKRCYDLEHQSKHPTYDGCSVVDEWHNFQNFAQWFEQNKPEISNSKLELDKDLFSDSLRGKVYGPETCCIIPRELNSKLKFAENMNGMWKSNDKMFVVSVSKKFIGCFRSYQEAQAAYLAAKFDLIEETAKAFIDFLPLRVRLRIENLRCSTNIY